MQFVLLRCYERTLAAVTAGKHFELSEWADYVRGLLDPWRHALLHAHLATGCASCEGLVHTLRGITEAAAHLVEPPPEVVERAKNLFSSNQMRHSLPLLTAVLVRDNLHGAVPSGVRAEPQSHRQTLFEAGDYWIDVRLERDPRTRRIFLTGQLASKKEPDKIFHSLPILLLQADRMISRTESNHSGEFWFDYKARRDLRIVIPVLEPGIEIRLGQLIIGEN